MVTSPLLPVLLLKLCSLSLMLSVISRCCLLKSVLSITTIIINTLLLRFLYNLYNPLFRILFRCSPLIRQILQMEVLTMNRNVESHFAQLPKVDIQRSIFDRSSGHKLSANVGDLIPIYVDEVLPGDTFRMTTSKVVRFQTLLTPVMDNSYMDVYWFYIPNRIIWTHWREFCGENTQSAWIPQAQYSIPRISSPSGGFAVGSIADYLGIPVGVEFDANDKYAPMALPFRAYAAICQEFFRDENLTDPLHIPLDDANQQGSNGDNYITDVVNGGKPFKAAKFHDFFSSCLPGPQKHESVMLPIGERAPVLPFPDMIPESYFESRANTAVHTNNITDPYVELGHSAVGGVGVLTGNSVWSPTPDHGVHFSNLWADLSQASAITVNDLRLAFQLQKFYERAARSGTRYTEILLGQYGVTAPDASLQRPEYLGGNRIPLSVHEVTNNAQSQQDFLGDLGAISHTSDVHEDFVKSFQEHGWLMAVAVVRYDHTYGQGLEKFWMRREFTDYYLPVFANLGEQPVPKATIYADGNMNDGIFGYQECWAEYRFKNSRCSSEMRPGVPNSLASWHLADYYTESPTLSDSWIREDKSNVDRVLAVQSSVSNQYFADFWFNCIATRPMPMYSIPGLIDHN